MKLSSLLYVSHSRIPEQLASSGVEQIVAASIIRNRRLEVTGALLFTGRHFAQVIEGPRAAVDRLWADIRRDIRHEKIVVLEHIALPERRFTDWNLAFFGPSSLLTRQVTSLAHDRSEAQHRRTAQWMNDLLRETRQRDEGAQSGRHAPGAGGGE